VPGRAPVIAWLLAHGLGALGALGVQLVASFAGCVTLKSDTRGVTQTRVKCPSSVVVRSIVGSCKSAAAALTASREADQSPVLYQNTKIPKYQTVFCPKYQKSKRVPCKIPKIKPVHAFGTQNSKFCLVGQIQGTSKKPKYQTE
jgi:hypothetical protein